MNILFASETLPGEVGYGGAQRTKLLFDALKKCGDVYCLYRFGPEESQDSRCKRLVWRERKDFLHYLNSIWWRIYQKIMPAIPGWEMLYYPFPERLPLGEIFPGVRFDVVVTRYYRLTGKYHLWQYAPLLIDVDDHPLQVYRTMVKPKYGWCRGLIGEMMVRMICRWMERKYTHGWIVSDDQKDFVKGVHHLQILSNIPLCPPPTYMRSEKRAMRLVTIGLMVHPPNIEGINSFLENVWPRVRECWPKMEYWLVGGGASPENARRWSSVPGVRVCGFVDDLGTVYASAMASVVPIQSGGGSCIKTLESLAYSCACLTTVFGARGIASKYACYDSNGLWVWRSTEDFIVKLGQIIENSMDARQREAIGRGMIEANYSLRSFENNVVSLIAATQKERSV